MLVKGAPDLKFLCHIFSHQIAAAVSLYDTDNNVQK